MTQRGTVLYCPNRRALRFGGYRWATYVTLALALVLSPVVSRSGHTVPAQVHIAVVKSLDLPQFNSAYDGFIASLRAAGYEPQPVTLTLPTGAHAIDSAIAAMQQSRPELILALGTRAAREVSRREKIIPIVYSMVLDSPRETGARPAISSQDNLAGSSLNIPLAVQLKHLQDVFPTARRIGLLSDPSQTKTLVDSAVAIAGEHGLTTRVKWIHSETEIPDAVRALTDSIDVLWMMPDQTVYTPRSSRFIIFQLIKAGVPIMGLSAAYVKAGAVIALDCDYQDIGRQSGELAVQILQGQSPGSLKRTRPRVFTLALNTKVQEHLRIGISEAAIKKLKVITF